MKTMGDDATTAQKLEVHLAMAFAALVFVLESLVPSWLLLSSSKRLTIKVKQDKFLGIRVRIY